MSPERRHSGILPIAEVHNPETAMTHRNQGERKLCLWLGVALAAALLAPAPAAALPAFPTAPAEFQGVLGTINPSLETAPQPVDDGSNVGFLVYDRLADHAGSNRPELLRNGLPGGPEVPIPEPASLILMGGALMVLRQVSAKLHFISPSKELN
jgi:hypothetical protein